MGKIFKSSFFGFNKKDVIEYFVKMEENFSQQKENLSNDYEKRLKNLNKEIEERKADFEQREKLLEHQEAERINNLNLDIENKKKALESDLDDFRTHHLAKTYLESKKILENANIKANKIIENKKDLLDQSVSNLSDLSDYVENLSSKVKDLSDDLSKKKDEYTVTTEEIIGLINKYDDSSQDDTIIESEDYNSDVKKYLWCKKNKFTATCFKPGGLEGRGHALNFRNSFYRKRCSA